MRLEIFYVILDICDYFYVYKFHVKYSLLIIILSLVPGPPKSLIVIGQGSDYLELLWEPPVYPNGILISYIISYRTGRILFISYSNFYNTLKIKHMYVTA